MKINTKPAQRKPRAKADQAQTTPVEDRCRQGYPGSRKVRTKTKARLHQAHRIPEAQRNTADKQQSISNLAKILLAYALHPSTKTHYSLPSKTIPKLMQFAYPNKIELHRITQADDIPVNLHPADASIQELNQQFAQILESQNINAHNFPNQAALFELAKIAVRIDAPEMLNELIQRDIIQEHAPLTEEQAKTVSPGATHLLSATTNPNSKCAAILMAGMKARLQGELGPHARNKTFEDGGLGAESSRDTTLAKIQASTTEQEKASLITSMSQFLLLSLRNTDNREDVESAAAQLWASYRDLAPDYILEGADGAMFDHTQIATKLHNSEESHLAKAGHALAQVFAALSASNDSK